LLTVPRLWRKLPPTCFVSFGPRLRKVTRRLRVVTLPESAAPVDGLLALAQRRPGLFFDKGLPIDGDDCRQADIQCVARLQRRLVDRRVVHQNAMLRTEIANGQETVDHIEFTVATTDPPVIQPDVCIGTTTDHEWKSVNHDFLGLIGVTL